jgi:hypothetical protein
LLFLIKIFKIGILWAVIWGDGKCQQTGGISVMRGNVTTSQIHQGGAMRGGSALRGGEAGIWKGATM